MTAVIEPTLAQSFDWCIENVRTSHYNNIANELEIVKALSYMTIRDFSKAIETLKTFEKKDPKIASTAATNLSFLYFLVVVSALAV
jgi:intraflagellar transport protein 88